MDLNEQLRRDESEKNLPYTDTAGKITIGVGFNLTDVGLQDDEIDFILKNRIVQVQGKLSIYLWYAGLDGVRRGAIENMAYNMGVGTLLHFPSMIHYLSVSDWANAAVQMRNSLWATQVGPRAERLARQIETGEWQ